MKMNFLLQFVAANMTNIRYAISKLENSVYNSFAHKSYLFHNFVNKTAVFIIPHKFLVMRKSILFVLIYECFQIFSHVLNFAAPGNLPPWALALVCPSCKSSVAVKLKAVYRVNRRWLQYSIFWPYNETLWAVNRKIAIIKKRPL